MLFDEWTEVSLEATRRWWDLGEPESGAEVKARRPIAIPGQEGLCFHYRLFQFTPRDAPVDGHGSLPGSGRNVILVPMVVCPEGERIAACQIDPAYELGD